MVAQAPGERLLFLDRQQRDPVHGADVGVERTQGAGDRQVVGDQGGGSGRDTADWVMAGILAMDPYDC